MRLFSCKRFEMYSDMSIDPLPQRGNLSFQTRHDNIVLLP